MSESLASYHGVSYGTVTVFHDIVYPVPILLANRCMHMCDHCQNHATSDKTTTTTNTTTNAIGPIIVVRDNIVLKCTRISIVQTTRLIIISTIKDN